MISRLFSHPVGLVHVATATLAFGLGTAVLFGQKGDRRHRRIGQAYFNLMLLMNVTALLDYELYGRFGPFHWMALFSLASVIGGKVAAWRKQPGWLYRHAFMMAGSYIGLAAAAAAEVASRVPGWRFGTAVTVSSAVVIALGVLLMFRLVPGSVDRIANDVER